MDPTRLPDKVSGCVMTEPLVIHHQVLGCVYTDLGVQGFSAVDRVTCLERKREQKEKRQRVYLMFCE